MNNHSRFGMGFVAMIAVVLSLMVAPHMASAQASVPLAAADEPCTDFKILMVKSEDASVPGVLTNITNYIKDVVNGSSQKLFEAFTKSSTYASAVNAAVTLMVVIYGVAFMIGVAQPSFGQVLIRLAKVGIIYAIISPSGGWTFFSDYAVKFFNDGTDQLIGTVMQISTGVPFVAGDSPFKALDVLSKFVLSPDMIIAIIGTFTASGPYPLMMGALLAFAIGGLLKMLLEALKTYAISFIMRSLLLGIAPIFIVFLLFDKTKQLFTGWLNALVNLSLQPILYFTFISFFLVMITTSAQNMLGGAELCWSAAKVSGGAQNPMSMWRFKMKGETAPSLDEWAWKGSAQCMTNGWKMPDGKPCPEFPLHIIDLLSFLILVYVAQRFSEVVTRLSSELSNAFVNLDSQTRHLLGDQQKQGQASDINQQRSNAKTPAPPSVKR